MRKVCLARAGMGAEAWDSHVCGLQAILWGSSIQVWTCGSISQSTSTPTRVSGQKWLRALPTSLAASAPMTALARLYAASHSWGNRGVVDCLYPPVPSWSPDLLALGSGGVGEKYQGRGAGLVRPLPWTAELHPQRARPQDSEIPDPKSPAPLPTAVLLWTVMVNQTNAVHVSPLLWVARNGIFEPVTAP